MVIQIPIKSNELAFLKKNAEKACIGGKSQVRKKDRRTFLLEDQMVGQIGNFVVSKHLFGTVQPYMISRWYANIYPNIGDGGSDIPGLNVDIKSSLMRAGDNPLKYNLIIRPHEFHKETVYILVLISRGKDMAYLVGWASSDMLPDKPSSQGIFSGAYILPADKLNPMMPFKWFGV